MDRMRCPECRSEFWSEVDCWNCNASGEDPLYDGEECQECHGFGTIAGEYECYDCGHEWQGEI